MDFELKLTSAEAGVKRSAQGFCTALATAGMPPPLMERLESLSVYRHLFPAGQPGEERNPIAFSHLIVPVFGEPHHVVSRVQSAGLDYSKRFNYFAHHRAMDAGSLPSAGPAWVVGQESVLQPRWDGVVATPPACKPIPAGSVTPALCRHWQSATGDAGWAGWILERWQANPDGEIVVIFSPGDPTLELVQECVALLPAAARWRFTFSTFATKLPPDVGCNFRFVASGTPEANARNGVDLRSLRGQSPPDSPFVEAARQGREAPIAMAPIRSAGGATPAGYKLSNLGELPPLPATQTSRPKYHADFGSSPSQSSRGRNIWIIGLLAAVMLGGAGYMFWDAQQREAARFAAAQMEKNAEEERQSKAKQDAKREFEDRRRKADEALELERQRDQKRKELLERDLQEEKNREVARVKKAKEDADKKAAEEKAKAPPVEMKPEVKVQTAAALPPLDYLKEDIKSKGGQFGGASAPAQLLFEMHRPIARLAIHGRVNSSYILEPREQSFVVFLKTGRSPVAAFRIDSNKVEFSWLAEDSKAEGLKWLLRESVLEVQDEAGFASALYALRVPVQKPALYASWITQPVEFVRDKDSPAKSITPPDKSECASWIGPLEKFTLGALHVRIDQEQDLRGEAIAAVLERKLEGVKPPRYETQSMVKPGLMLRGDLTLLQASTLSSVMPLKLTFAPTGAQLWDMYKKQLSKANRVNGEVVLFKKAHFDSDEERIKEARKPKAFERKKAMQLDNLIETLEIEKKELASIGNALTYIDGIRQRKLVGSIYFLVPVRNQMIAVDAIRFGSVRKGDKKKDEKK